MKRIIVCGVLALGSGALAAEAERLVTKRAGEYVVQMTLRPGEPKPGRLLEVQIEVDRVPDFPDPVYGDRVPVRELNLLGTLAPATPDLNRSPKTYALHELGEGATYGLHAIPETGGVYTLELKPRTGGTGPKVTFDIGVGVAMATEAGEGKKGASRRPAAGAGGGRMVVSSVGPKVEMRGIGESWVVLEQLAGAGALGLANAQAEAKAIAALLVKAKDKPPKAANPPGEYHEMLDKLAADFNAIAAQTDPKKVGQAVAATETACLKCHVEYRWELTADVSRWPKFDVAEGKAP